MPPDSISSQIKPTVSNGEVSELMRSAMVVYKKSGDRQPLRLFLKSAVALTECETAAACKLLDSLNPAGQGDQLPCCLDIMEAFVRAKVLASRAAWMEVCKAKFLAVLLQVLLGGFPLQAELSSSLLCLVRAVRCKHNVSRAFESNPRRGPPGSTAERCQPSS
eukprot:6489753-Amphidinium_carterae.1